MQQRMQDVEISALKKLLTQTVIEMHGIAFVIGREAQDQRWKDLQHFAEQLSSQLFRKYSHFLRERRRDRKERMSIYRVSEDIQEILAHRDRIERAAMENEDASRVERRRVTENHNPRIQTQLEEFWARLDESKQPPDEP